jgi:hypothetical protein
MSELVRVAALSGYFETMAGLGVDPRPLLKSRAFRPTCWSIRNS